METLENCLEHGASKWREHEKDGAIVVVGFAGIGRDDVDAGEAEPLGDPPRRGAEIGSDFDAAAAAPG